MTRSVLSSWLDPSDQAIAPREHAGAASDAQQVSRRFKIILGLCGLLLAAAATLPISGAVIAQGTVGSSENTRTISHANGGIVDRILVRDGDQVRKGQLLLTLDTELADAVAQGADTAAMLASARIARLDAEARGATSLAAPSQLDVQGGGTAYAEEARLFATRREAHAEARRQLAAQAAQIDAEIAGLRAQSASLRQQSELLKGEQEGIEKLWERRLVTLGRVNEVRRTSVELASRAEIIDAAIRQAAARKAALAQRDSEIVKARMARAGEELAAEIRSEAGQDARRIAATRQRDETEIRAPIAGMVANLAPSGGGQTVRPTEPLLSIVPSGSKLVIETKVSARNIDQISVGQSVKIRFPALRRSVKRDIAGKVTIVAPIDVSRLPAREAMFRVRVDFNDNDANMRDSRIKFGMPAEVFIQTDDRTVLSYLFKSIVDQLGRVFRND